MNAKTLLPLATLLASICAIASGQAATAQNVPASQPAPVRVGTRQADALAGLARSAMATYLKDRTAADKQAIPSQVADLQALTSPVLVRLRHKGQLVAQAVAGDSNICRNVISAAVRAMRSPSLPDRITRQYLAELTVELELAISPAQARPADLPRSYVPALHGLRLAGQRSANYAFPTTAYESGLNLEQMKLLAAGPGVKTDDPSLKWEIFENKHFVSYPGGPTVWLYRGKVLALPEAASEMVLMDAADSISLYLRLAQAKDGCFTAGPAARATMVEHLYATYAMARQAKRAKWKFDPAKALSYAAAMAKSADGRTYLATERPAEQLLTAAWYVLASSQAAANDDPLREKLAASIAGVWRPDGSLPARLDGQSGPDASPGDVYLAAAALAAAPPADAKLAQQAKELTALARQTQPKTAIDALWKAWAGLDGATIATQPAATGPDAVKVLPRALDETGGYAFAPGEEPSTMATALKAIGLARQLKQARAALRDAAGDQAAAKAAIGSLESQLAEARFFCYQMMYKEHEAYFAAVPNAQVGGVRTQPGGAAVTVAACAAAMEALGGE